MNRRRYLKLLGATAAAGALAGCGGRDTTESPPTGTSTPSSESARTPSGESETASKPYGFDFDTVLHAVDDLGMDPTGERPIDDAFANFLDRKSTLLEFPPGRYRFENSHETERANTLGVRGIGEDRGKVTFWTPAKGGREFINIRNGGNGFLLADVTFDHGRGAGSIGNILRLDDNLRVQNVEHVGFNPTRQNGAVDNLSPQILSKDGTAIVDTFVRTGPTSVVSHGHLNGTANAGCIWLGEDHVGRLVIRNSLFKNTGTNTIYCSRAPGGVEVRNSEFVNNNQASIRIGGRGSFVKNCTFRVDTKNAASGNKGKLINPNGIVWETGNLGLKGGYIENCTFVFDSAPKDRILSGIWADGSAGAFEVRNCRFVINVPNARAIRVDDPRNPRLGATAAKPWGVKLTNIVVEGEVATGPTPLIEIKGRPNSVLSDCCLSVPNGDGIVRLVGSPGSSFRNINVTGSGNWLTAKTQKFVTKNITRKNVCAPPTESIGAN